MKYPKIVITKPNKEVFFKNITILGLVLLIATATAFSVFTARAIKTGVGFINTQKQEYCVILDAGHGGFDGGAVVGDVFEKDINLKITNKLNFMLKASGFKVISTRNDDSSTESDPSLSIASRKKSDLKNRLELAKQNPNAIFVSIHLNKYPSAAAKGAQMFFSGNHENSEVLAENIKTSIVSLLQNNNTRQIKNGTKSTFLLRNSPIPTVIVECGFMSNPEEMKNLLSEEYQTKTAFAIYCGILNYYNG